MNFPFQFSSTAIFMIIFAFIAPLIYSSIWVSRKANNKRAPPEAAGAWPIIGHLHLLGGAQPPHITLGNLADKHGPIFTIKLGVHRTLIVSNWEMAKACLTTNDKAFASRPKSLAMEILGYNYSMPGFSPYGSYWSQMRKIITHELVSNHRLEMLKHVREIEVKASVGGLYQQWIMNKNCSDKLLVEMKRWFNDITLNVILKIIVGKRFVNHSEEEQSSTSVGWRESLRDFMDLSGMFVVSDALPFLRWLDLGGVEGAMKKTANELDNVVQTWLEERKQKKASGIAKGEENFMDAMLSILDDTTEKLWNRHPDKINKATCLALILAASDTTANTLTWTLSLLLNNRSILKKAQDELDRHVGRERQVKESDMKNLVYLEAIIKESFRLCPPTPLSLPHESMEECTVNGYYIPAGTRLLTNISKIHRDPNVWSDPNEFQPDRFLTTHKDCDVRGQCFELIPFGSGRRMCPGISFAVPVLNLSLASLLHGFDIETQNDKPIDMTVRAGLTNAKETPLEALLTPRLPAHLYEMVEFGNHV